jgi:biopolymer transport protein ExbD
MRLDRLQTEREEGLNLTPLIDVVFLLLVFFLAATTFSSEEVEMELNLPEATTGESAQESRLLTINVREDGSISVDGRVVSMEGLAQKLRAAAARDRKQRVLIRGDTRAQLGVAVQAFDACRAASLRSVSIAALPVAGGR